MGTVIGAAATTIGGTISMLAKGGLPPRICDLLMRLFGLRTLSIGISKVISAMIQVDGTRLQVNSTLLLICSLGIGVVARELLCLENHMEGLTHRLQSTIKSRDDKFVEGLVSNALIICVGTMAVVRALQDGLTRDASMLITKAILNSIVSMVFTSALGISVVLTAVSPFPYQGAIIILTGTLSSSFGDTFIRNLLPVGNVLIFGAGINLFFSKQVKIDNLLSILLIPVVRETLQYLISGTR